MGQHLFVNIVPATPRLGPDGSVWFDRGMILKPITLCVRMPPSPFPRLQGPFPSSGFYTAMLKGRPPPLPHHFTQYQQKVAESLSIFTSNPIHACPRIPKTGFDHQKQSRRQGIRQQVNYRVLVALIHLSFLLLDADAIGIESIVCGLIRVWSSTWNL